MYFTVSDYKYHNTKLMFVPREYQIEGCDKISQLYQKGIKRIVRQLPTGAGKTKEFSMLTARFIAKINSGVLILVNREVLAKQTISTLYNDFGIKADAIMAGAKSSGHRQVKVSMVETAFKRLSKDSQYFGKIGLLIVDEAHYGEFKKIYSYFPNSLIIAVTATPVFSTKKDPMKNYFDEIVVGPSVQDIINLGSLVSNETFVIKGVNTKKFGVKNGEYDQHQMGSEYSNYKHVHNTVDAYKKLCNNEKTIIFNCNIEHSKLVMNAFIEAGYTNIRHLDGTEKDPTPTLNWFAKTQGAILCNVMKLTAGFDEPSIINVIANYSTLSLTKWLQSVGRASRPYPNKNVFRIIDMGGNYELHGDWRDDRDWYNIFHNPDRPKEGGGVAPIKMCKECEAIIPAQAMICKECGYIYERTVKYDLIRLEFEKVVSGINTAKIINDTKSANDWQAYFIMEGVALTLLKKKMGNEEITPDIAIMAFEDFENKIKEWRSLMPRKDYKGNPILENGEPVLGMPYSKNIREYACKSFSEKIVKYNKSLLKMVG